MATDTFTYSKSTAFPGGFNSDSCKAEIEAGNSGINVQLLRIDTNGDAVELVFKQPLPADEKLSLDGDPGDAANDPPGGLLAAHDPTPLVQTEAVTVTSGRVRAEVRKPGSGHDRVYAFSINFCDRTTWWHDAVEATDQVIATQGQSMVQLANGSASDAAVIDLSHGRVSDENNVTNPRGEYRWIGNGLLTPSAADPFAISATRSGYVPIVKKNGAELTERRYGWTTGGDYTINYDDAQVNFFVPLNVDDVIDVTYWWVDGSAVPLIVVDPTPGTVFVIDKVEIQTTDDVVPTADIFMFVEAYMPEALRIALGQPLGTKMHAARPTVVKNVKDIISWAHRSYPNINALAPASVRGMPREVRIHEVRYLSEIALPSSAGAVMKVTLDPPVPFGGTWAAVVIYGFSDTEE